MNPASLDAHMAPDRHVGLKTGVAGIRRQGEHAFFITVALSVIVVSIAAFGPSILIRSGRTFPLSTLVAVHGVVTAAWLLLFLTQATLIATGRISIHRRVGWFGFALALLMVAAGYLATVGFGRRGLDLSGDVLRAISRSGRRADPATILFPVSELVSFAVLVAAGIWYRHRPEVHKRLMLFALIPPFIEPVLHLVGHLSLYWPVLRGTGTRIAGPVLLVLLSVSAVRDRLSEGRIHPVSLIAPILLIAWQIVIVGVVFPSVAWHSAAVWLIHN
jgi:hypothetical protein